MANEITHDSDAALTAALNRAILEEARAAMVIQPTCLIDDIGAEATLAKKYTKSPTVADAGALTDGTAASNTGINPTSVTVTAAGVVLVGTVTDLSSKGSLLNVAEALKIFGRAVVNKWEADAATLIGAFTTVTGSSGVDLTIGNWITALFNVELANEDANVVSVLHPIQLSDLRGAVSSAGGALFGNPGADVTSLMQSVQSKGDKGSFLGVPIKVSTEVNTANSGADRAGAMYSQQRALVWLWKWRLMTEIDRDIKMVADEIAVSCAYGTGELFDGAGTTITTDA